MAIISEPFGIPKTSLPDANRAMDPFFELFPDRYPFVVSEDKHHWWIGLRWPDVPNWYVDPNLAVQARKRFALSLAELPTYYEERKAGRATFLFSMFHSRALLTPAMALRNGHSSRFTHVVHVDAHDDLRPPLLRVGKDGLFDPLAQSMVDLSDVYSVTSAIDRGVISKGSFLAAYILGTPPACAIHVLDQGLKLDYDIVVDSLNHTIGSLTFASSAPSLIPSKDSNRPTGWRWQELPFLPLNLNNCRSVWLDVDLDAFCNRYDGDSDRAALLGTESERAMLLQGMDAFLDRLSKASWRSQINAVSIAASPGFFPSEYWDEAIPKITDGLTNLLSAAP